MRTAVWRRRDFLWAAGAFAAGATITVTSKSASASGPESASASASLANAGQSAGGAGAGDFEPGLALGPCRLVAVLPVDQGALPFVLCDPQGRTFVAELHVHDPGVRGIARAGSYEIFLRNGGSGSTPTHEAHGLGAMALATLVAEREASGRPIPQLASIVERWASEPPPLFR